MQKTGESYNQYRTALIKLAQGCEFQTITPDEILRDRLVFGIRDNKVQERLLRKSKLTLAETDEICHSMLAQMKEIDDNTIVSAVKSNQEQQQKSTDTSADRAGRGLRGHKHELYKRELCRAFGKMCNKCHKPNHFAAKCRSKPTKR